MGTSQRCRMPHFALEVASCARCYLAIRSDAVKDVVQGRIFTYGLAWALHAPRLGQSARVMRSSACWCCCNRQSCQFQG